MIFIACVFNTTSLINMVIKKKILKIVLDVCVCVCFFLSPFPTSICLSLSLNCWFEYFIAAQWSQNSWLSFLKMELYIHRVYLYIYISFLFFTNISFVLTVNNGYLYILKNVFFLSEFSVHLFTLSEYLIDFIWVNKQVIFQNERKMYANNLNYTEPGAKLVLFL